MKYIIFSFFFLGLASCSLSNPLGKSSEEKTVPEVRVGGVQTSDSGVSASSESGNVSVGADGSISVKDGTDSISVDDTGVSITSEHDTVTTGKNGAKTLSDGTAVSVWKDEVRVGTGIQVPAKEIDDMSKDPEIQGITEDIDTMLNNIEKGGK